MPYWEHLAKPISIGSLTAKNRVEAAPTSMERWRARDGAGGEQTLPAESVVLAPNLFSSAGVVASFLGLADEVYVIGDCRSPRILFNAIHEGFEAALRI